MAIVTGDRYLEKLVRFVDEQAGFLIEATKVLKLNPAGLHYVQSRLEALLELEQLLAGAPVDYLRAYISDLGDHRALEQLRRILRLLTSLKVVSALPPPARDPTPLSLLPFGRLKVLELRGCDLSTSAARGLLELRHTLEKIICHNSTDALRHVFASRIAEIKDSSQWNRLSFVSCACNRLLLMDESLQLLPAVETLDLSRNKFAKVDNLRKCTKLKYLDLGFNHLRSIAYFIEVSCHIVKLVLRNNALTALRGIENLKSLEELDVSYNMISNFSELEFLTGLPSLRNLWLEGNPLCCARWYRPQVFSYFVHPDNLKLDDKEISTREFWKRRIIIARRQKQPANFGFYHPAKIDAGGDGNVNKKRRKMSRLASIESRDESISSDQEISVCDDEIQSKDDNAISDDEAEIVDLINRVEQLKKERSILWLREFKEWMDHTSENFVDGSNLTGAKLWAEKENYKKSKKSESHFGESSRYILDSSQASGDESSRNVLESDSSFADMSSSVHVNRYFDHVGSMGIAGGVSLPGMRTMDLKQEHQESYSQKEIGSLSIQTESSHFNTFTIQGGNRMAEHEAKRNTMDEATESHSFPSYPGSPPQYQEDLLHRRHNLVEEILQLSAESYSVASSDSDTSCSEDDFCDSGTSMPEHLNKTVGRHSASDASGDDYRNGSPHIRENGICFNDSGAEQTFTNLEFLHVDKSPQLHSNDFDSGAHCSEVDCLGNQEANWLDKRKNRRKSKKRVISFEDEKHMVGHAQRLQKLNGSPDASSADVEDEPGKQNFDEDEHKKVIYKEWVLTNATKTNLIDDSSRYCGAICSSTGVDDFIEDYFNNNVADLRVQETCRQYMRCNCILDHSVYREREVALVLSSEDKLYVLLIGVRFDGSGIILSLLGHHRVGDIQEIVIGLGFQVVRVQIEGSAAYLFLTRSMEKSRQLLCTLDVFNSCTPNDKCTLRSLEQLQVGLFDKQICGGSKLNMYQYSMVHFWQSGEEEGSWLSRSLFVIGGHVIVCIEDLKQFSTLSNDANSRPYFLLNSCCSITDVSEMVIDRSESWCVTLILEHSRSCFLGSTKGHKEAAAKEKNSACSHTWKLKWFSEESLFQFVALLKAIRLGTTPSPLRVRCLS
ncbi:hypothetical protein SLE2022_295450 [Rubroshorea leprosula]